MFSRLIESAVIGILAGGWASCTYWQGAAGVFVGFLAFGCAMFWLTIRREEEAKENRTRHVRSASPYKKCARG